MNVEIVEENHKMKIWEKRIRSETFITRNQLGFMSRTQ